MNEGLGYEYLCLEKKTERVYMAEKCVLCSQYGIVLSGMWKRTVAYSLHFAHTGTRKRVFATSGAEVCNSITLR